MFWKHRMDCLWDLKEIGYQVGCGFMVGSPEQTVDTLYEDLQFIRKLQPHMVGIGPFIPQKDTPFGEKRQEQWKIRFGFYPLSGCCSRMCCCHQQLHWEPFIRWAGKRNSGRGKCCDAESFPGSSAGKYKLYDNKICTGDEAAECRHCMARRMESVGYKVVVNRGDYH